MLFMTLLGYNTLQIALKLIWLKKTEKKENTFALPSVTWRKTILVIPTGLSIIGVSVSYLSRWAGFPQS